MTEDEIRIRACGWENYVSYLREKGMTYKAIAEKTGRSSSRIQQVQWKYEYNHRRFLIYANFARPYFQLLADIE
jgi:uncharacterized protein YerC